MANASFPEVAPFYSEYNSWAAAACGGISSFPNSIFSNSSSKSEGFLDEIGEKLQRSRVINSIRKLVRKISRKMMMQNDTGAPPTRHNIGTDFMGNRSALQPKTALISNDYQISNTVLGLGINGKVVECFHKKTGEKFALKVSRPKYCIFCQESFRVRIRPISKDRSKRLTPRGGHRRNGAPAISPGIVDLDGREGAG